MSNNGRVIRALLVGTLLSLAGCAGTPPRPDPPERVEGRRLLRGGIEALSRGDRARGERLLLLAQRHFDAIGDREGGGIVRVNRARLARRSGDREMARTLLDEVGRFPPADAGTLDQVTVERGLLALAEKRFDDAVTLAAPLIPRDDPHLFLLGAQIGARGLLGKGDRTGAAALLDRVIPRSPAGAEGEGGRVRLLRARIAIDAGDDTRALPLLREAIDLLRSSGEGRSLLDALTLQSALLERLGDHPSAQHAAGEADRIRRALPPDTDPPPPE